MWESFMAICVCVLAIHWKCAHAVWLLYSYYIGSARYKNNTKFGGRGMGMVVGVLIRRGWACRCREAELEGASLLCALTTTGAVQQLPLL